MNPDVQSYKSKQLHDVRPIFLGARDEPKYITPPLDGVDAGVRKPQKIYVKNERFQQTVIIIF